MFNNRRTSGFGSRKSASDQTPRKKLPPKITEHYLQWVVDDYLKKFFTSKAHLRRLIMQRVKKSAQAHGEGLEEGTQLLDALLDRLEASGVLNDTAYAASKVRSLSARGGSARGIAAKLGAKGLSSENVKEGLEKLKDNSDSPELDAAIILARRKRLGPFGKPEGRMERRQKEMAAMGRAGFSFDLARKIINATDDAAIEELRER